MDPNEWLENCAIDPPKFYEAFGESEWVNHVCYVWRPNAKLLTQVRNAVVARNSPIIPIGGMYGAGKSAFKWALKYLLEENGDIKVTVARLNYKTSGFSLCTQVADSLGIRELFGTRYPKSRHEVLNAIEKNLKQMSNQIRPVLVIDDAHFMESEAYLSVKSLCDFDIAAKRICPVILLGESAKVDEYLKSNSLAQVRERAQIKGTINLFTEVDGFELIARGLSYSKGDPLGIGYDIDNNQLDARNRCRPFSDLAVARILNITRLPRQIKQLIVRTVEIQAEKSDDLPQDNKFIITPDIINEAHTSLGWST